MQFELRIPRTIFEPVAVEVVERHPVEIQEGDYVEVLVGGIVGFEGELVVLGETQTVKLVRVRRAMPTAEPSKLTRQASEGTKA